MVSAGIIVLRCTVCEKTKPIFLFRRRSDRSGKGKRLGRYTYCIDCEKKYANSPHGRRLSNQRTKKHRDRLKRDNPSRLRENERRSNLKRLYDLTISEYNAKAELQGGVCAICGNPPRRERGRKLHVDHDHQTGQIRSLLCVRCNSGLGKFRDDPELLIAASKYLERWQQIQKSQLPES